MRHEQTVKQMERMPDRLRGQAGDHQEMVDNLPSSFCHWAVTGNIAAFAALMLM